MSKFDGLLPELKDQLLEISLGDEYEEMLMSDNTKKVIGVIFGILKELVDDFLVVDCFYMDKHGTLQSGNIVYINTWAVKVITKVNSKGCLNDVLLSSDHTRKMKQLLGIND